MADEQEKAADGDTAITAGRSPEKENRMSKSPKNWLANAGPWVPIRLELLESVAWRARSIPLMRMLLRLEIEHMYHGGAANGDLCVSYGQFENAGVARRDIKRTIALGKDLGLLEVKSGMRPLNGKLKPENRYRLTYLPTPKRAPTDEWKKLTQLNAVKAVKKYRTSR